MSASDQTTTNANSSTPSATAVPKRITNAQTVCNEKNEKGKLCNGHLKQLRTAGEAAEIHLRGDDVLFKCQTCGTFYMGPPLGHVRDPQKQVRFVEAELAALLQAAGGTLPVIKKDDRGVYVMLETGGEHGHGAKPAPAKPAPAKPAPAPKATPEPKPVAEATAPAAPAISEAPAKPAAEAKPAPPAEHKAGAQPNRQLFKRSTYAGVTDTGPVPGETFQQKVARLAALSAAAKKRADEGGESTPVEPAPPAPVAATSQTAPVEQSAAVPSPPEAAPTPPPAASAEAAHKPTGKADRALLKRSTYCGVVDTGPVPGETFEQKVARLTALAAAAKQRAEGG